MISLDDLLLCPLCRAHYREHVGTVVEPGHRPTADQQAVAVQILRAFHARGHRA